jgi:hypothetical protein
MREHNKCGREERRMQILFVNSKRKTPCFGDLDIDVKIILKLAFKMWIDSLN